MTQFTSHPPKLPTRVKFELDNIVKEERHWTRNTLMYSSRCIPQAKIQLQHRSIINIHMGSGPTQWPTRHPKQNDLAYRGVGLRAEARDTRRPATQSTVPLGTLLRYFEIKVLRDCHEPASTISLIGRPRAYARDKESFRTSWARGKEPGTNHVMALTSQKATPPAFKAAPESG